MDIAVNTPSIWARALSLISGRSWKDAIPSALGCFANSWATECRCSIYYNERGALLLLMLSSSLDVSSTLAYGFFHAAEASMCR
ncbi:hypothetical protein BDW60DRAFT_183022 [Aspergillus nidulans var. acristatus]